MILGFLDLKTIYLIVHIFGVILGAGGAFTSDAMFFSTVKDGVVDKHELRFMRLGGRLVWLGILVMIISGIFLVSTDPVKYLSSSKFLVKITVVGVIIINGIIFHFLHLPFLKKHLNLKFSKSKTFIKNTSFLMASGALSMVSWITAVILGMLKHVPYTYFEILSVYITLVLVAVTGSFVTRKKILNLKD